MSIHPQNRSYTYNGHDWHYTGEMQSVSGECHTKSDTCDGYYLIVMAYDSCCFGYGGKSFKTYSKTGAICTKI